MSYDLPTASMHWNQNWGPIAIKNGSYPPIKKKTRLFTFTLHMFRTLYPFSENINCSAGRGEAQDENPAGWTYFFHIPAWNIVCTPQVGTAQFSGLRVQYSIVTYLHGKFALSSTLSGRKVSTFCHLLTNQNMNFTLQVHENIVYVLRTEKGSLSVRRA